MSAAAPLAVDGATRLFGIVGDPIAQVGSPRVFTGRMHAAGRNALMLPMHVPAARFEEVMPGLMALANLDGLIITVPFKARALALLDEVRPAGRLVGAVNAMRREPDGRWTGDNFDGSGFIGALRRHGQDVAGRRVMLIGAGGAGSAIAVALAEAGVGAVTIFDIDLARAESLAARLRAAFPAPTIAVAPVAGGNADILVNATPVGMGEDARLPAPIGRLDSRVVVFDAVQKPEVTPLLRHAAACGCVAIGGRHMLEGQADVMSDFFGFAAGSSA
jgi:shikimate dehydrogenase